MSAEWFEVTAGCASFTCTARGLAAFVRMLVCGGDTPGGRYLSETSFDALISRDRMQEPFDPEYI
ncbi:MAG: hypothetical protein ABFD77_10115 [Thermotogota bacterium]